MIIRKTLREQVVEILRHKILSGEIKPGERIIEAKVAEELIAKLIVKHFNLTPAGIIKTLDLRRPIYKQTAAYGHFGRTDVELPWEKTDKAEVLRQEAGL